MTIEHIRVVDLTPEEIARCKELSLGEEGYMCETLDEVLVDEQTRRYRYTQAILLKILNNIVGWALVQPIPSTRRYSVHLFVDPAHRKLGYGSLLLQQANRWCKAPVAMPDELNAGFFDSHPNLYTVLESA